MSGVLSDKHALVVGGGAGIGRGVAGAFVDAGARVIIGGRRAELAQIAQDMGAAAVRMDVASEQSVRAALAEVSERHGVLDVLVLNAGVAQPPASLAGLSSDEARRVVETNLLGSFWGLKHGAEAVADGGSIVLTSSISAVTGTPFEGLYGATKAGVSALARSAAIDLGPRGIRVNAVQPGPTWTDMNPMPERLSEVMAPLGRKGTVEDLLGVYVFLASDASRYVTGQALTVDGGTTAGVTQALLGVLADDMRRAAGAA